METINLRDVKTSKQNTGRALKLLKAAADVPTQLTWTTTETGFAEENPLWFILPGIIGIALVVLCIYSHNYFFLAFLILSALVLSVYAYRSPREVTFTINPHGIQIHNHLYHYSDLKSFWVFNKPHFRELSLETKHFLTPFIHLPFGDEDHDKIAATLLHYLPEEEHEDSPVHMIARSFGM